MHFDQVNLIKLRQAMRREGIDYYWIPGADAHANEYVPVAWRRRAYISGFTGSNGDVLVGLEHAWLWTDGRYFLQAEQQLDEHAFSLMRMGIDMPLFDYLVSQSGSILCGVDPRLMTLSQRVQWQKLSANTAHQFKYIDTNLVDAIWQDQPRLPNASLRVYPECYSGQGVSDKLARLRETFLEHAPYFVTAKLDSIAWLTNLRGQDLPHTPVFISYLLVSADQATLYVDATKLTDQVQQALSEVNITTQDYDALASDLAQLKGAVWLDPNSSSVWLQNSLIQADSYYACSPVVVMKACKNAVEQQGMRDAHRRDALAMIRFLAWLEQHWQGLDEVTAADQLAVFRAQDPLFQGLSFDTICGYADHGAIIHYQADSATAHALKDDNLILLDSGGQYLSGTTDITRMVHLGQPSAQQRHHYTLVLKGHLALSAAVFVHGTCGEHLDALARAPLWAEHLDYGHGTGHGVGCYLECHEGPQRIARVGSGVALLPGMVVSNEPGLYLSGQYGIRIENLLMVKTITKKGSSPSGHGPFYGFETLTRVPYNRKLMELACLSSQEKAAIDAYHANIYAVLHEELDEQSRAWLARATAPLPA